MNACGRSSLEVKRSECDDDYSRPTGTELKNECSCKYTRPIRLYVVDRDKFQCLNLHLKHRDLRALMSDVVNNIGPRKKNSNESVLPIIQCSLTVSNTMPGGIVITYGQNLVSFLGAFPELRKASISFVMSVCPSPAVRSSVRMEQHGSIWTDFYEI